MDVFLNRVDGIDDAVISMYLSKRTLTRELEQVVRREVSENSNLTYSDGNPVIGSLHEEMASDLRERLKKLFKWGARHMTMLRFIDLSFTVYGLHRAGQDDFDSHAMRLNNRIIRSSTRLADFQNGEMSEYYSGKIIPTDLALTALGITLPERLTVDGRSYVRSVNGYIMEGMDEVNDVKRGLYMLSIPSNFIFRVQLTEFAHIYKERNIHSNAHYELKNAVESMATQIEDATCGFVDRSLLMKILN